MKAPSRQDVAKMRLQGIGYSTFVTGSACLSGIIFALCTARLVHKGELLAISALVLARAGGMFARNDTPRITAFLSRSANMKADRTLQYRSASVPFVCFHISCSVF